MNSLIQDFCELRFYCRSYPNWTKIKMSYKISSKYVQVMCLGCFFAWKSGIFALLFVWFHRNFPSKFLKLTSILWDLSNLQEVYILFSVCFYSLFVLLSNLGWGSASKTQTEKKMFSTTKASYFQPRFCHTTAILFWDREVFISFTKIQKNATCPVK